MVTFKYVPRFEVEGLSSAKKIHKLVNIVKENKVVLLEGQLESEEQTDLIEITMDEIDDEFKGVEVAVVDPEKEKREGLQKIKYDLASSLLGYDQGVTIIGPASKVEEIKNDPEDIELQMKSDDEEE